MTPATSIGGTLFPSRFLEDGDVWAAMPGRPNDLDRQSRRLARWWRHVESRSGPATGIRTVFDLVAEPLAAHLGFRLEAPNFEGLHGRAALVTPDGSRVALLTLTWASRPSSAFRDAVALAASHRSRWCLVVAPPFVSVVDARGHAVRHAVDFKLPDAVETRASDAFWVVTSARSFEGSPSHIERLVELGLRHRDEVRSDLQEGVLRGLSRLERALSHDAGTADNGARQQALTIIYRVMFLLFAEARGLVPVDHPVYRRAYAVTGLCRDAVAGHAPGSWQALAAVTRLSRSGCRADDLIVSPFNGQLFSQAAAPALERQDRRCRGSDTANRSPALSETLAALGSRPGRRGRELISYSDLGVEQLGAVYERVLGLEAGRRKQTGSFYTPESLAAFVVRRTLAPLVAGRDCDAILRLRVVDPAMGSGAFLVAACRYLAGAYERAYLDEGRGTSDEIDREWRAATRRLIAERCLAGVDVNPVAVQLARLSLWLASLARGKPLGFFDHQLRVGNSLIGAAPDDLRRVPVGRRRRAASLPLFDDDSLEAVMREVAGPRDALSLRPDDTVDDVRAKERAWRQLTGRQSPLRRWRLAASLWCARWFWPEAGTVPSPGETRAALDGILRDDITVPKAQLARWAATAEAAAARHRFFHWPLEFSDVFHERDGRARDRPGFDAVIGNPPWEMLRRDEAERRDGHPDPRRVLRFVRDSGLYPHCDRGHLNLYQPFLDRALALTRTGGRLGLVLPWGFATDDGARPLRDAMFSSARVDCLVGLDNAAGLFPVHRALRFMAITATRGTPSREVRARFGVRTPAELDQLPELSTAWPTPAEAFPIVLSVDRLSAFGGPTRRIPCPRSASELAWLEKITARQPALGARDGWDARFGRELNATEHRSSFGRTGLPVVDGRNVTPFAVRVTPARHRIPPGRAARLLPDRGFDRPRLGYRDVSGVGNRMSLIAAVVPSGVVTTHTVFCLRTSLPLEQQHFLAGIFNSYIVNRVVRLLMGGHVTTSLVEGLPVPRWRGAAGQRLIARLARRLATGWVPEIEAALQAAVAREYGVSADEFDDVLEGFPLVDAAQRRRAAASLVARGFAL